MTVFRFDFYFTQLKNFSHEKLKEKMLTAVFFGTYWKVY